MKARMLMFACMLTLGEAVHAQATQPSIQVCLRAFDESTHRARYRVTIDWNGFRASEGQRIDIGVRDPGHDVWPQLRDDRLRPTARPRDEHIVISNGPGGYPLQLFLIGLTPEAARAFDQSCRDGYCSLTLPTEGVTEIGPGVSVGSVREAAPC